MLKKNSFVFSTFNRLEVSLNKHGNLVIEQDRPFDDRNDCIVIPPQYQKIFMEWLNELMSVPSAGKRQS